VNHYAPLVRDRGFRAIWTASAISGLGDRIAAIALYLLIFRQTGSPVDLGILAATQIVPAILLGPVTGLVCDRFSRKRIMIASDLVSAAVVAAIPLVQTTGQVYLLAVALGCGRQFNGPARLALLPDVLPAEQLGAANSLLMLTRNVVLLVGPAVGAALVAWRGTDPAFWVDAATFVLSAGILAAAGLPARTPQPRAGAVDPDATLRGRLRRLRADLAAGLAGVLEHPGLRLAFGFFAVLTFVTAMQQPLVVVFVKDVLQGSDVQLGLIISAAGLGGILGALSGGLVAGRDQPLRLIALLTALDGILLVVFALNRSFVAALLLFACFGALATLVQIALATYLQATAPADRRGRVFGWLGTIVGPLSLASVFLGPLAATLAGVVTVLVACGLAEVGMGVVGARGRPQDSGAPAVSTARAAASGADGTD
jgi:MFS transporter, DHA3 family, macrolide efflux protein